MFEERGMTDAERMLFWIDLMLSRELSQISKEICEEEALCKSSDSESFVREHKHRAELLTAYKHVISTTRQYMTDHTEETLLKLQEV